VNGVASGGVIAFVQGSYTAANGNTMANIGNGKPMTLRALTGPVTIGN
jgi:hypothetical protein